MKINLKLLRLFIALFAFISVFIYTLMVLNPVLFYFTQQPAFLFTGHFFTTHLSYPGGIGYYISLFFEQFMKYRIVGALIMTLMVAVVFMLSNAIVKKIFGETRHFLIYAFTPLLIFLLLWHNVKYPLFINVQLALTFLAIYIYTVVKNQQPLIAGLTLSIIAILVYYISGAPYLYVYIASISILLIKQYGISKFYLPIISLILGLVIPFLFYHYITPVSIFHAWLRFSPSVPLFIYYKSSWLIYALFAYFPVLLMVKLLFPKQIGLFSKLPQWAATLVIILIFMVLTPVGISKFNNSQERIVTEMGYDVYQQDWNSTLQLSSQMESYDRLGNFYFNIALYKTDNFGSSFFSRGQLLGIEGLFVDNPLTGEICMPSSYLYYHLGLINNALRYAYEAQTLLPDGPYVLMQIIDCLITADKYEDAKFFLDRLNENLLYRGFVKSRLAFIKGENTGLKRAVVNKLRRFSPKEDFYTANPQYSVYMLYKEHHDNRMAFNYLMVSFLLEQKLNNFIYVLVNNENPDKLILDKMYQEAMLVYLVSSKNIEEGARRFEVNDGIKERFMEFNTVLKKGKKAAYPILTKDFSDTYWYYLLYESPMVTKAKVKTRDANVKY